MKPKTLNHNQDYFEQQLFAIVALLGIDEALAILQRERERVVRAINGDRDALRQMTLGDFFDTVTTHAPAPRPKRVPVKVVRALPPGPHANNNMNKSRMHDALCSELSRGPVGIAKIVAGLERRGVVNDVSPETKKTVMAFLAADKTFSIRTRGVYAIRSKTLAA